MSRYSWAVGRDSFVICHSSNSEMYKKAPYGIVSPVFGASKLELIDILEAQDEEEINEKGDL